MLLHELDFLIAGHEECGALNLSGFRRETDSDHLKAPFSLYFSGNLIKVHKNLHQYARSVINKMLLSHGGKKEKISRPNYMTCKKSALFVFKSTWSSVAIFKYLLISPRYEGMKKRETRMI